MPSRGAAELAGPVARRRAEACRHDLRPPHRAPGLDRLLWLVKRRAEGAVQPHGPALDTGKQCSKWAIRRQLAIEQRAHWEDQARELRPATAQRRHPTTAPQAWGSDGRDVASSQYLALNLIPSSSSDFSIIQRR